MIIEKIVKKGYSTIPYYDNCSITISTPEWMSQPLAAYEFEGRKEGRKEMLCRVDELSK